MKYTLVSIFNKSCMEDYMMKNFGFGCMRLPMNGDEVDLDEFTRMVDLCMAEGFNYFDTAKGYVEGRSEGLLKTCLTSRYPRESYILTDKLSEDFFKTEEDIRPLFHRQLDDCGVEYFDYYLMHSQNNGYYEKYLACNAYKICCELKAEGKIKHFGISFHDKPQVLERILKEQPEIEVVQLQINYVDMEVPGIEGRRCLELCREYGKPVIVMEPVKGGHLARLPKDAAAVLSALGGGSPASYAIRYAASLDGVMLVLSGMSNMEQMRENLDFMKAFKPLDERELSAVEKVRDLLFSEDIIPCTACHYCSAGCPKKIAIPELIACLNDKKQFEDWNSEWYYMVHTQEGGKALDCIKCGKCEESCPQHLEIRELMTEISGIFDKAE